MKKILISILFVAALTVSSVGMAAVSTRGTTGVIDTPTADVLMAGHLNAAAYNLYEGNTYSLGFGLGSRWEIATVHNAFDSEGDFAEIQLKYALRRESIITPGLAIGIDDALDERERSVYAVMSKGLPFGIRMNLGLGDGRYNGVFGSLEKQIIKGRLGRFPTTMLLLENDGHDMNYGLRLSLSQKLKLNMGWRDDNSYVGLSGSF